jgi:type I restriction enzyme S subunit
MAVAFGDVVRLSKERSRDPDADGFNRYVGLEHIDPDNLHIRRWGNVADGTTFTSVFRPGQVLFGKRRAYQRKVAVADFDGVCSGDIYVLESTDPSLLLPELLPFICQTESFLAHAVGTSAGSLSPRTQWRSLAEFKVRLPSMDEQRRLSAALLAVERLLESLDEARSEAEIVKASVATVALESLGERYGFASLGEVAEVRYGLTVERKRRSMPNVRPYLRVANVLRGGFDLSEVKKIGSGPGDNQFRVLAGDVLVVEGHADRDDIGRAARWRDHLVPEILHQNHLIRVRAEPTLIDAAFVEMAINSPRGRQYFKSRAASSSGLYTVNSSVVGAFGVPRAPLEDQRRVVRLVDDVDRSIRSLLERRQMAVTLGGRLRACLEGRQ